MPRSLTPLRYPGGKGKLTPFIEELLQKNNIRGHYVEPYAGGAGVAINLLLKNKIAHVHLNDSNIAIYAFWHSVLNQTEELCDLISNAILNIDEWKRRKEIVRISDRNNLLELGFSVFYLNRCNRSGILSGGVIGGSNQTGNYLMDARFQRGSLVGKIRAIASRRNSITVTNYDAEDYINTYIPNLPEDSLIYLDPPYYEKSSDLYLDTYFRIDHFHLAEIIQSKINHRWVLSYDGVPIILNQYKERRSCLYKLQYSAANSYKGQEVFIFCDNLLLPSSSSIEFLDRPLKNLIQRTRRKNKLATP